MIAKCNGGLKPVITLNTMQIPALFGKRNFSENVRLTILGPSPISPTPDVKVHFNSPRDDLKNAYLQCLLSASVLPKLTLIAFGGIGHPSVVTPLIRSNSVPTERTP